MIRNSSLLFFFMSLVHIVNKIELNSLILLYLSCRVSKDLTLLYPKMNCPQKKKNFVSYIYYVMWCFNFFSFIHSFIFSFFLHAISINVKEKKSKRRIAQKCREHEERVKLILNPSESQLYSGEKIPEESQGSCTKIPYFVSLIL